MGKCSLAWRVPGTENANECAEFCIIHHFFKKADPGLPLYNLGWEEPSPSEVHIGTNKYNFKLCPVCTPIS